MVAFVVGAAMGAPGSPAKDAANRFAEAWAAGSFAAMYRELNAASRGSVDLNDFVLAYREASRTATLRSLEVVIGTGTTVPSLSSGSAAVPASSERRVAVRLASR